MRPRVHVSSPSCDGNKLASAGFLVQPFHLQESAVLEQHCWHHASILCFHAGLGLLDDGTAHASCLG